MGMHIDKAGVFDPVGGVDLLAPPARYLTYLGNPSVEILTSPAYADAPVPSTTVPPAV